jgi:hypothetical protein
MQTLLHLLYFLPALLVYGVWTWRAIKVWKEEDVFEPLPFLWLCFSVFLSFIYLMIGFEHFTN